MLYFDKTLINLIKKTENILYFTLDLINKKTILLFTKVFILDF